VVDVLHVLAVIQVFVVTLDVLCAIGRIAQGGGGWGAEREAGRVVSVDPAVCFRCQFLNLKFLRAFCYTFRASGRPTQRTLQKDAR